ncbi:MAG: nucleotidyltransferase domain-containing protein [Lachnospiraceae bacterium]|nr:nucleotidyltransferase domain-containing protein [Lachnospiraceae bacterium]
MCYTINEIRERAVPIAKEYGVKRMGLFGSYARGDANDESDVDIYIDKGKLRSLIRYFMFVTDLEKALQCHVDVVTTGIEDRDFLDRIKSEGVLLYEE